MKKAILSIALVALLCLSSCAKSTYEMVISQLEDADFDQVDYYENERINEITDKLKTVGIELSGDVLNIVHFVQVGKEDNDWIYVYNFEIEADAEAFMEGYASNWQNSRREGTVVFYGKSSLVDEIRT